MKKWFYKSLIRKLLNKERPVWSRARGGILLVNGDPSFGREIRQKLYRATGIEAERWDILYLARKLPHPDFMNIYPSHFNWRGKPVEPAILPFFQKPYRLLIDWTTPRSLFEPLVSAWVNAALRAGKDEQRPECYDLIIDANNHPEVFLNELHRYLQAMQLLDKNR